MGGGVRGRGRVLGGGGGSVLGGRSVVFARGGHEADDIRGDQEREDDATGDDDGLQVAAERFDDSEETHLAMPSTNCMIRLG